MENSGRNSFCCGAGGAQVWKEEEHGTKPVNTTRFAQAQATGAKTLAIGCPFCSRMLNDANAEALTLIGDVTDRDVIIVDDEVDTGGSIAQAIGVVKKHGARDVYLAFIHPIFSKDAAQRLAELPIKRIITTDTVSIPEEKLKPLEARLTVLSIAPMIGEVIRRAHEGRSVGEMFNE